MLGPKPAADKPSRDLGASKVILGDEALDQDRNWSPPTESNTGTTFKKHAVFGKIDGLRETVSEILKQYEARLETQARTIKAENQKNEQCQKIISELEAKIHSQTNVKDKLSARPGAANHKVNYVKRHSTPSSIRADSHIKTEPSDIASFPRQVIVIAGQTFDMLPPGDRNEGLYVERWFRKVQCGEEHYEEKIILEPKLSLGEVKGEEIDANGVTFARVSDGDYKGRLVSMVEHGSLVQHNGRTFTRRLLRKEIPKEAAPDSFEL